MPTIDRRLTQSRSQDAKHIAAAVIDLVFEHGAPNRFYLRFLDEGAFLDITPMRAGRALCNPTYHAIFRRECAAKGVLANYDRTERVIVVTRADPTRFGPELQR